MKQTIISILLFSIIFVVSCKQEKMHKNKIRTPMVEKKTKIFKKFGDERVDEYYWLNERDNVDVLAYLSAENEYYDTMTAHTKEFQKSLFKEMKSRIKEDDESVPYFKNGYYYLTRFVKGGQYPIYARKKNNLESAEEIMFDVNQMAEGYEYYQLGGLSVSPNNQWVAFAVDTVSRRQYNLQFKNLISGEILPEVIPNTTGGTVWAADNKTVFYTKKNPTTLRSEAIYRHTIGTDPSEDVLVYHEKDNTYGVYVSKSKSEKYIFIISHSTLSTETRYVDARTPEAEFKVFQPRERNLEYDVAHYKNHFYILTNKDSATNFKIMKTSDTLTGKENWVDVLPHRETVLLEDMSLFRDYMVVEERNNGLNKIRVIRWDGSEDYYLPFDEETYAASVAYNPEFNTKTLRYRYNSLTTPTSIIDFDMSDKTSELKKEQKVLGGKFDKRNYESRRLWVTARDGKKVAISLVKRKETQLSSETPLLLYAYGSYGYTVDPGFSTTRLSLLDRGFVFAIAHVRGGEYLGRQWYEDGKLLNKKNTFTDFIDCAKFLIEKNYTSAKHLYAQGGSAGGLLMGAIVNMDPTLFYGVIAQVPFVDVVTTMLDESIPLTTGEYDEWGNPNNKEYYEYIKSYSPYDNVSNQNYPNMLVTTGLHDSQVQYFEPAKWVAKLRDMKTDNNVLLLHIDMDSGHGGASGRFDMLKDYAREYAFLLDLEGIEH